ncbi:MAG: hypothetical protein E7046_06680 [Lentisphaerae bacterium]|nr:hypothetical protein [Lentisphaerota bacterium]
MTPSEVLLRRNLVASGLSSAEWSAWPAAVRDRAFFSSRVESVRFLETCRTRLAQLLDGAKNKDGAITSRAQVVSDIMRAARDAGIAQGTESLTDPGSVARANVIIDTNAAMAAGYARAQESNTLGARLAFPAQELVRIEERVKPRDWRTKWVGKGGKLYQGRMIALKEDPIWIAISRFKQPYPPFDFNSGMGLDDVSYDEAVKLGVMEEDYQPPDKSPLKAFNESLEADLKFKTNRKLFDDLHRIFGDQIRHEGGTIHWRHDAIKEAFISRKPFTMDIGEASPKLMSLLPNEHLQKQVSGKQFVLNEEWLNKKRSNGKDHRSHFIPLEDDDRNIPLEISDLELIPAIYHEPDYVEPGGTDDTFVCVMADGNGDFYRLVLDAKKKIRVKSFYKRKFSIEEGGNDKK